VSLLIKCDEYRPKLVEGVVVAIIIGLGVFSAWFDWAQSAGESGLGVIVLGPMYIVLCIVMGIVIAHIYKKRNKSIFKG